VGFAAGAGAGADFLSLSPAKTRVEREIAIKTNHQVFIKLNFVVLALIDVLLF
jgi:hypothetical protein